MTKSDFIDWLCNCPGIERTYRHDDDCWWCKYFEIEILDNDTVLVGIRDELKTPESFSDYKGSITFEVFVEKYNQISEDEEREYFRAFF